MVISSIIVAYDKTSNEITNKVESVSEHFDWSNLAAYYDKAYDTALERKFD